MAKLDSYSFHEALDRAHIMATMFDEFVTQHRAVSNTPRLKAKAEEIAFALGEFYQLCGSVPYEDEDGREG